MEGIDIAMDEHILDRGKYVICDPAFLLNKNEAGDELHQQLIVWFYADMNRFHHFKINQIDIYMFRTEGGDGIFDGVGTDTGTFVIVNIDQISDDERFRHDFSVGKIIVFESDEPMKAIYEHFDLIFSNGIIIHTT